MIVINDSNNSPGLSQDQDKENFIKIYLTPDLLSDHLFRNVGNATTIIPRITIAYI